jgi:hypothetical protein
MVGWYVVPQQFAPSARVRSARTRQVGQAQLIPGALRSSRTATHDPKTKNGNARSLLCAPVFSCSSPGYCGSGQLPRIHDLRLQPQRSFGSRALAPRRRARVSDIAAPPVPITARCLLPARERTCRIPAPVRHLGAHGGEQERVAEHICVRKDEIPAPPFSSLFISGNRRDGPSTNLAGFRDDERPSARDANWLTCKPASSISLSYSPPLILFA